MMEVASYGSTTYAWNTENQLSSVTTPNGTDIYTYDSLGRRATIDVYHLGYIGQSDLVSYVTDNSNNLVKRFTYNAAGLPALMSVSYGGAWYTYGYVYDGTGQIVGLVDDTTGSSTLGEEVVTYTYDAWGNLLSDTDTSGIGAATINPFLYKGYWYDWSTGLYDLNARYYNPVIGRFLSEDPVGPSVGSNVPGYNGYAYARNNPVNRVDPSGTASYNVYLMARFGIKERATNPTIPGWIVWTGAQVALLVLTEGLAGPELLAADEGVAAAEDTVDPYKLLEQNGMKTTLTKQEIEAAGKVQLQMMAKSDLKMVNDAAKEVGVDRNMFGEYIHEVKQEMGMRPKDNFTYQQLLDLARELKNSLGK